MNVIEVTKEYAEGYNKGQKYVDSTLMFKNIIQQVFPDCPDSGDYNGVVIAPLRKQWDTTLLGISLTSHYWINRLHRRVMIKNGSIDEVALKAKYKEVRQHASVREADDKKYKYDRAKAWK